MPVWDTFVHGDVEGVRVGRFNAGLSTTSVVYRFGRTVIDSGPPNQWAAVQGFLDAAPPARLLLTHHHEDHAGNAARIASRYGLVPQAPQASRAWLRDGFGIPPIQHLVWGAAPPVETDPLPPEVTLDGGVRLDVIPAPGHAPDMVCLHWPDRGWLFSADLFLSRRLTHLRYDEDLGATIASLDRVLDRDFDTVFCAHRGVVLDGHTALRDKRDYLANLCERSQALRRQGRSVRQIRRQLLGAEDAVSWATALGISKRNLIRQALAVGPAGGGGVG